MQHGKKRVASLVLLALAQCAEIEVTDGGMVTSPTFKFTHSTDGSSVTLVGDPGNTKITTTSTLVGAAVGVGPTGSSYSKKLHVRGSGSTDTTPQSGNGLNGAALGEGVVIHNSGAGSSAAISALCAGDARARLGNLARNPTR
jgi:hypothetical protein